MHISRALCAQLQKEVKRREVTILLGPRQVGKTYLLRWLEQDLRNQRVPCTFYNLEDPGHLRLFAQPPAQLFQLLTTGGRVVFIDEFHYLQNASQLFKAIYDSGRRVKLFASGSSSIEIHKHLHESLAGRRRILRVPPLTYQELRAKLRDRTADYYLRFGGLPGVANEPTHRHREQLLVDLLQAYLLKDIKALIKEENVRAFNLLLYLLAQSQGSLISVESLARQVGLTARSIQRYLDLMTHTYVLGTVPSYSRNLGNELVKSKKYYLYDGGIRHALLKDFRRWSEREDKGAVLESAAFLNLSARLQPNEELRFWRTRDGQEVDFVVVRDRQPIPIEVKSLLRTPRIPSGLQAFLHRYPRTLRAFVLNPTVEASIRYRNTVVSFTHWANPVR